MSEKRKPILDVLQRKPVSRVPFWLMRQAGRYLPEYRELRAQAGGFLELVYDPEKAAEITLQPLRRFGMDAAILFSDILVVPHALGQPVKFETGEGPVLSPVLSEADFSKLKIDGVDEKAAPVYETVSRVREKMKEGSFTGAALIGFCGSPWTVACYMVEGRGSREFEAAQRWALSNPDSFQKLIDIITQASIVYLSGQIKAGAEAVQLFESWGGILDADQFFKWVIEPTKKIRSYLRENFPHIPVIGFPNHAGMLTLDYARHTGVDGIGVDDTISPAWAAEHLQPLVAVQGNLNPVRLLCGGTALEEGLENIRQSLSIGPFILNLGHGVIKETSINHVYRLAEIVRGWSLQDQG